MQHIKHGKHGIKSYSVVGWTYNADTWCNDCAEEMGITNDKSAEEMDSDDGYAIFADSEWDNQPHCGGCECEIPYVTAIEDNDD